MLGPVPFHVKFRIRLSIRNFFGILLEISLSYMWIWGGMISLLCWFFQTMNTVCFSSFLWFLSSFKKCYLLIYFGYTGSLLWCAGFPSYSSRALASCRVLASLPWGMWDFRSPTRDQTWVPCIGRWILNHWTTREVSSPTFW